MQNDYNGKEDPTRQKWQTQCWSYEAMGPRVQSQDVLGHAQICEQKKPGKTESNSD